LAKKKTTTPGVSKSDAIRDLLAAQPNAGVKEIKAKLDAKGIQASTALIGKLKYSKPTRGRRAAKRAGGASKAEAIRLKFEQLGRDARPRDVIAALKSEGTTVTSAQVSMLRSKMLKNGVSKNGSASRRANGEVSFEHLLAAKSLADRLGGISNARQALESLARLMNA
jgi:hypothetical protein